jgi:hypothetical protein
VSILTALVCAAMRQCIRYRALIEAPWSRMPVFLAYVLHNEWSSTRMANSTRQRRQEPSICHFKYIFKIDDSAYCVSSTWRHHGINQHHHALKLIPGEILDDHDCYIFFKTNSCKRISVGELPECIIVPRYYTADSMALCAVY